jgi:hypothetical protein
LTLAPIWHDHNHATTRNQRSDDDGGHHRDDGDHPRELDEVSRRSKTSQLLLLATNTVLPKITRFHASWFDGQQEASASRRRSATTWSFALEWLRTKFDLITAPQFPFRAKNPITKLMPMRR